MSFNANMIKNLISASLYQTYYEASPFQSYQELYDHAAAMRHCLKPLYPLKDSEWGAVITNISKYADFLVV